VLAVARLVYFFFMSVIGVIIISVISVLLSVATGNNKCEFVFFYFMRSVEVLSV
jgi:ABC-type microcin C transport system permease subunit YejE